MGELAALVKKHPELIGIAVIVVIIFAYLQSKNGGSSAPVSDSGVTFTGGGVTAVPVDPNAAAIQEAQISANSANLTTLSQLWLGLNEAAYQRDVAEGQTGAALTASLAATEAAKTTGLAQTAAQIETARIGETEQLSAANVTSQMAANAQAAQLEAIRLDNARQLEINATQRDIARVNSKSHFWDSLFGGAVSTVAAIFGG